MEPAKLIAENHPPLTPEERHEAERWYHMQKLSIVDGAVYRALAARFLPRLLVELEAATARATKAESREAELFDCLQRAYGREMAAYTDRAQRVFELQTQVGQLNRDSTSLPFSDCQNEYGRCLTHCGSCRVAPATIVADASPYEAWHGLRRLVDLVWQYVREDESVPSTILADKLIISALDIPAPLPSSPAAAPVLDRQQVVEAMAGLLTTEGEHYSDPAAARAYEIRLRVNASVGIAAKKLGIYDELNRYWTGPATTTGEGKEQAHV